MCSNMSMQPLGVLDQRQQDALGAHHPGVGHVEAEPEQRLDPVAFLLPAF